MFDPNLIILPQNHKIKIEKTKKGCYIVINAYQGTFEYFKDRPININYEKCEESKIPHVKQ